MPGWLVGMLFILEVVMFHLCPADKRSEICATISFGFAVELIALGASKLEGNLDSGWSSPWD